MRVCSLKINLWRLIKNAKKTWWMKNLVVFAFSKQKTPFWCVCFAFCRLYMAGRIAVTYRFLTSITLRNTRKSTAKIRCTCCWWGVRASRSHLDVRSRWFALCWFDRFGSSQIFGIRFEPIGSTYKVRTFGWQIGSKNAVRALGSNHWLIQKFALVCQNQSVRTEFQNPRRTKYLICRTIKVRTM